MVTNPNDPISPIYELGIKGLTKREYFAAAILQGLCANPDSCLNHAVEDAATFANAMIRILNEDRMD